MLIVAAALALQVAAVEPAPQRLQIREQWVFDRFAADYHRQRRRADPTAFRVSSVDRWAPLAGELLDGASTLWTIHEQRKRLEHLRWPRGEMNPLLRPLAHHEPAAFMVAKAGIGLLKVWRVGQIERRVGPEKARTTARVWTGMSLGAAAFNAAPTLYVTLGW